MIAGRNHIVVHQADLSVECLGCHRRLRIQTPVEVEVWIAAGKEFADLHAGCATLVVAEKTGT